MTRARVHDATFQVVDEADAVVLTGSGASSARRDPGATATPRSTGSTSVACTPRAATGSRWRAARRRGHRGSPWPAAARSSVPCSRAGVAFDQNQRDGASVLPGPLDRQPSHLNDAARTDLPWPRMERGSDLILDRHLHRIGGPVDVSGGWFDAGDYLKFTHSTAYNDVLLFSSARLLGRRTPPEPARRGEARSALAVEDVATPSTAAC